METYNKCRVIILPTDKSNLFIKTRNCFGKLIDKILEWSQNETYIKNIHLINSGNAASNDQSKYNFYHLYILSEEEIKEGDWCYVDDKDSNKNGVTIVKIKSGSKKFICEKLYGGSVICDKNFLLKIIASTDPSLNLPQIPQSFISFYIEKYNKENIIEEVEVEYEDKGYPHYYTPVGGIESARWIKDIRLKINPDNTISIKPLKNSWNREEVISLLEEVLNTFCKSDCYDLDNWIKQNL